MEEHILLQMLTHRYMRMKGYNVLFPMGFHYTGTPILAMSRRVASQDKELIDTFRKVYNISDDVIQSFVNPVVSQDIFMLKSNREWRKWATLLIGDVSLLQLMSFIQSLYLGNLDY